MSAPAPDTASLMSRPLRPALGCPIALLAALAAPAAAQPAAANRPAEANRPAKADVSLFGRIQLIAWSDPQNQGDVPDQSVVPGGSLKKEWGTSLHLNATLGGRFAYPQPIGGFVVTGVVMTAVQVRRIFSVPVAGFTLEHAGAGVKIGVGKLIQPTASPLSPSSFQFSTNWGNLLHATTGAYVAKAHGRLSAQLGVGRPSLPDFTEALTATAGAAPRLPFVEGRLAYSDPEIVGMVPSGPTRGARPGALTFSLSGARGAQRAGVGELAAVRAQVPGAVAPLVEEVPSWLVSVEALVPCAGFVLTGEAYLGEGANSHTGAVRQRPAVDPATGRHTALPSRGGWLQLSYALPERWTILALAGLERVDFGGAALRTAVAVDGSPSIRENRLLAAQLAKDFAAGLHVGVQVQHQLTRYRDLPTGRITAVLAETSIEF